MDKETEITQIIAKLGTMIKDWDEIADEDIQEFAEKLIIGTARKLIAFVDEKSEMPCNCHKKTLQDIIDEAKAKLTDNKTFAVIIFRAD